MQIDTFIEVSETLGDIAGKIEDATGVLEEMKENLEYYNVRSNDRDEITIALDEAIDSAKEAIDVAFKRAKDLRLRYQHLKAIQEERDNERF